MGSLQRWWVTFSMLSGNGPSWGWSSEAFTEAAFTRLPLAMHEPCGWTVTILCPDLFVQSSSFLCQQVTSLSGRWLLSDLKYTHLWCPGKTTWHLGTLWLSYKKGLLQQLCRAVAAAALFFCWFKHKKHMSESSGAECPDHNVSIRQSFGCPSVKPGPW